MFIHSGVLFNQYYIPRDILDELVQPIINLARSGTRILIIPGNQERFEFPFDLFHGSSGGFVFSAGRQDTVSRETIPLDFDYIAAGHIQRYQDLKTTQAYLGKVSESEAIRWMDIIHEK